MILVSSISHSKKYLSLFDSCRLRNNTRITRNPLISTNADSQNTSLSVMEQPKTPLKSVTSPRQTTWCTRERRKSRLLSIHTLLRQTKASPLAQWRSTQSHLIYRKCLAKAVASADRAFQSHTVSTLPSLTTTHSNLDWDSEREDLMQTLHIET